MSNVCTNLLQWWNSLPGFVQLVSIGALLGSSFLYPYLVPLLFIGLPLFWLQIVSASSCREALWRGWFIWFIKSAFALSWFLSAYPLDSIVTELSTGVQLIAIIVYWLTAALWLSSAGVLLGVGVWVTRRWVPYITAQLVLISCLLVIAEVMGAWVFSVASTAPGIPLHSAFAFGFIGVPSVVVPGLVGWSYVGGLYGVSALIGIFTLGITYWQSVRGWYWVGGGGAVLVGGGLLIGQIGVTNASLPTTIAVIETNFSAAHLETVAGRIIQAEDLKSAFSAALNQNPQYILFPEGAGFVSRTYPGKDPVTAYNYYRFDYQDPTTIVIDSVRHEMSGGAVLRGITFDGVNKTVSQIDKQYLVPQGEYVPYLYGEALRVLGFTDVVDSMQKQQSYFPGPLTTPTKLTKELPPILFCFASSDPQGVRQLVGVDTAPFIAHPIAHTWFHNPTTLWYQLDQFLRIQAAWNQVPIVSAGNMAPSKVYLPDGSITVGEVVASGELWRVRLVTLP